MEAYRIFPIGYNPQLITVLIYKDNEGKHWLMIIRGWIEIDEDQYNDIINIAKNDDELFEITQIL